MNEEYNPEEESWEEYQQRIMREYTSMYAGAYIIHYTKISKILLFFKNIFLSIKIIFTTIVSKIPDIISLHTNIVTIRPAPSMMTTTESNKQSIKLKNLKQFAEWMYKKKWTHWDKEFNWDYLDTWCYDEKPDDHIGWKKTYIITISYPSCNGSYAIAFTDKPFYKLKSSLSDNEEIAHKYPKLLECVTELKTGTRDESKLYQKHKINIFE